MCKQLDLVLNPTKTYEIVFTTQRQTPEVDNIILNDTAISQSQSVKYLGVTLDNKLRFEDHIKAKVTKCRQRLYSVKQIYS